MKELFPPSKVILEVYMFKRRLWCRSDHA